MPRPARVLSPSRVAAPANPWAAGPRLAEIVAERDAAGARFAALLRDDYHSWPDWPLWRAVGLCEQRGDGEDGIAWQGTQAGGTAGSGYPGGLGLSRDFWRMFAPEAGVTVTNGAWASPADQIRVARAGSQNGTRMRGWSSWPDCVHRNGG